MKNMGKLKDINKFIIIYIEEYQFMKVYEQDNTVILEDIRDFNPKHIFECGQCFRWIKEDDESYTGVAKGRVINVQNMEIKFFKKY